MATEKRHFKPGEDAPMSGRYRATGGAGRETTLEKGERLPPIPGGGEWEFIGEGI